MASWVRSIGSPLARTSAGPTRKESNVSTLSKSEPRVTADNYKPVFLQDVTTTNPNGVQTPVNPVYCLTDTSAAELVVILEDLAPRIVMAYPYYAKAPVTVSTLVPWFKFPSGCAVNAGVEAN